MWMLAASAAPGTSMFPLEVGNTWTYDIVKSTGIGPRLFLFFGDAGTRRKVAEWTLEITGQHGERYTTRLQRTPATGYLLPTVSEFELWEQQGELWMDDGRGPRLALEAHLPPHPIHSERVRCVASLLGGVVGTCPPRFGGPLNTAPGLETGIVTEDKGDQLGRFLVGLMTIGMLIPGDHSSREVATLVSYETQSGQVPSPPGRLLTRLRGGVRSPQALARYAQKGTDAEDVAAVVVSLPATETDDLLAALLPALSHAEQYPVLRAALSHSGTQRRTLARARNHLAAEIPEPERAALLALFDSDRRTVETVLDGKNPLFTSVVASVDGSFDSDVYDALDQNFPQHQPTIEQASDVLRLFRFDTERLRAIDLMLPNVPAGQRTEALILWLEELHFPSDSLKLLNSHHDDFSTLSRAQRKRVLTHFDHRVDEARASLDGTNLDGSPRLPAIPEHDDLLAAVTDPIYHFDKDRFRALQREAPVHTTSIEEGRAILDAFSFDDERIKVINLLLAKLPLSDQGAALVSWIPLCVFDDAQLTLIVTHSEVLNALRKSERRALASNVTFRRSEARALLGL